MDFYPQPTSLDIMSTAGAVPVKNEKGELSMQKVKVHRYVSGKRPEYAPDSSSEEESEGEDFIENRRHQKDSSPGHRRGDSDDEIQYTNDPRLRRLKKVRHEAVEEDESDEEYVRAPRRRHIHEPEVLERVDDPEEEKEDRQTTKIRAIIESSEEEEEEELSDTEIERRRRLLRERVLTKKEQIESEILDKEEEGQSEQESEEESSEYEEYSDSDDDAGIRLKPVFVRKKERVTIFEREKEIMKKREAEIESRKLADERRKQTLKIVEEEVRKETTVTNKAEGNQEPGMNDVDTGDENDEAEYEAWKQRELKRIKRDREEREAVEKEKMEIERLRNMTEEERRMELRNNPKVITNKAAKGKYKFMQKYYHRGVFYMDKDEEIFKRDYSEATLEDHFDKTILPRVMQVKNFGRSGRTKYTHLVDQDTTHFESPWISETAQNIKFFNNQAAGCKQVFERPSRKRK